MSYALFVLLGAAVASAAMRVVRPSDTAPTPASVRFAALLGAVFGAYLFELPADLLGWAPPVDGAHGLGGTSTPLGGRTVLGALLGGWIAVEVAKRRVGHRTSTGDHFAFPLALALAIGRLGCVFTGCCPGVSIDPQAPFARVGLALHGSPRFPATLAEAYFHAVAAVAILIAIRRGMGSTVRLTAYFAAYGVFRFVIEFARDVPRPFAGASYYQLLALGLAFAAGAATVLRLVRQPAPQSATVP